MAFNQYAKTERDFTTLLNSANMTPADRDKLSAVLASLVGFQATQPGTNQTLEEQIANIDTEIVSIETQIGDIVAAINNIKVPVWKMQVFDADGAFTVPESIAGSVVYVTGSGGGGSGAVCVRQGTQRVTSMGGFGGEFCIKRPLPVSAGDALSVVVGAGGLSASVSASVLTSVNGNDGQDSSIGSIVLGGGSGGRTTQTIHTYSKYGGSFPGFVAPDIANSYVIIQPPTPNNGFSGGALAFSATGQPTFSTGGAAGTFGDGSSGVVVDNANATALPANANTGAGGGAASVSLTTGGPYTATSGAGGSGKIIVEWQEFA